MVTVDILMATYNGERYVREQVESIRAQTFEDWRLLVSDDCSTDGTMGVVREIAAADPRVEVVSEGVRYGSAKANFMHLISLSDAPYAMFCDQDDVWLPEKVSASLERMRELEAEHGSDTPLLVFCDMRVVDSGLGVIDESFLRMSCLDPDRIAFRHLIACNVAAGCSMLFNRSVVQISLRALDISQLEMHDWWLMLASSAFGFISYIDKPLSLYRQHGTNEVGARKYSPLERAKNQPNMYEEYVLAVHQAKYFRDVYLDSLRAEDASSVNEYLLSAQEVSLVRGVMHLAKSGCWKRGVRKLGQIAMIRMSAEHNRRRSERCSG